MTESIFYTNKETGSNVIILKETDKYVKTSYIPSGITGWFLASEFYKMFRLSTGITKDNIYTTYENKRNKKQVHVLKREKGLVQVRYVISRREAWYSDSDFKRMFQIMI